MKISAFIAMAVTVSSIVQAAPITARNGGLTERRSDSKAPTVSFPILIRRADAATTTANESLRQRAQHYGLLQTRGLLGAKSALDLPEVQVPLLNKLVTDSTFEADKQKAAGILDRMRNMLKGDRNLEQTDTVPGTSGSNKHTLSEHTSAPVESENPQVRMLELEKAFKESKSKLKELEDEEALQHFARSAAEAHLGFKSRKLDYAQQELDHKWSKVKADISPDPRDFVGIFGSLDKVAASKLEQQAANSEFEAARQLFKNEDERLIKVMGSLRTHRKKHDDLRMKYHKIAILHGDVNSPVVRRR